MKTKYFYLAALASLTLASCSSDDFIAEAPPVEVENTDQVPIMFSSIGRGMTRADFVGADAAKKLGNQFVVFGYKGAIVDSKKTGAPGATVFDNYLVKYEENTAHTTESNTNNWEYVLANVTDKIPIKHAVDNGITQQSIKYWDYSADQYDFIAWSTGSKTAIYSGTPTTGKVLVSEIAATAATSTSTPAKTGLTKAYTFEGEADDLKDCYISDLVTVYKKAKVGNDDTYNVVWKGYQQPVTLRFRQLGTKVRIGIYETVPGYSVKDVKFYSEAANALLDESTDGNKAKNESAKIFTTVANGIYKEGTYTVYFPTVDAPTNADNNQAHIDFAPKSGAAQKTTIDWGKLDYTIRESGESSDQPIYLGRTSNTATFANKDKAEQNYYEVFLPNEEGTNLNLRVNYTLESIDGSKETIVVKGATAQVPSIYTTWKPGYAYTYLFKISDKTNGHTGKYDPLFPDDTSINSDPVGLYPITFDAVVVNAEEDKTQETITTVSTPSITTYQKGSEVVNQNEYKSGSDYPIFVTVNDGGTTYEQVTGLQVGNSVAGYYTKADVYTQCESGTIAASDVTYYQYDGSSTYTVATTTAGTTDVSSYYTKKEVYTACASNATAENGTKYYRMTSIVENGKVVKLTNSGNGLAALYTLPSNKTYTEADVVDAMQMQDNDDAGANTIKGRSGLVLTSATSASPTLVTSIQYGVNGNEIDLTKIPSGSTTYEANALRFTPTASTTYAFVYTKTEATGTPEDKYGIIDFSTFTGTKYRYGYKSATPSYKDTSNPENNVYDAQKGVNYYTRTGAGTTEDPYVYAKVTAPFIGQGVSNLYLNDQGTSIAKGYAVTNTTYYYTINGGQSYIAATNIKYEEFASTTLYYIDSEDNNTWKTKSETTPVDGRAYYTTSGSLNSYCVILPQSTKNWYEIDTTSYEKADETTAIAGQTYFDKYTKNNGVYYVKIIKVQ